MRAPAWPSMVTSRCFCFSQGAVLAAVSEAGRFAPTSIRLSHLFTPWSGQLSQTAVPVHHEWPPRGGRGSPSGGARITRILDLPSSRSRRALGFPWVRPLTSLESYSFFACPRAVLRGFLQWPNAGSEPAPLRGFATSRRHDRTSSPTATRGGFVSPAVRGNFRPHAATVSEKEVEHFNKLSAEWWDVNGLFAALHDYNPRRVGFIRDNLQRLSIYQSILSRPARGNPCHKGKDENQPGHGRRVFQQENFVGNSERGSADEITHCTPASEGTKGLDGQCRPQTSGSSSDSRTEGVLSYVRILDVGCGGGILSEALAREGALVTGLDAAGAAISVAERRRVDGPYAPLVKNRQHFVNASLEEFFANQPVDDGRQKQCGVPERNSFDVVVCSEMLEHVEGGLAGVEAVVATAARAALAPGGLFVLTTLNRTPENYLVSVVAAEHLFGFIPKGTHEWNKFLKPQELRDIAERHGLRQVGQQGVMYVPFLRTFINEPLCRFMYMLAFQKL
ncbi:3-demethylubiquinone-9 3-o-methyltransferase [Cystoisospora suis]|uniref:Ubiquinone biosynthesis O-methyltransferase, mitochondrial n=1 Tax=Cystoisospora suis TaxID=483139 RepID=A0A2C6KIH4_9APIC|nr:3-demethylubiquinone-9 3-o-methyltransferase [Cystoisospora suis]